MRHGTLERRIIALALSGTLLLFVVLVVVSINHAHAYPMELKQKAQLRSMAASLELFNNELNAYPPSDANDPTGKPYGGAMKLAEALMGRDLLGFHSQSVFRRDGRDAAGVIVLYPDDIGRLDAARRRENLEARKGPYLWSENVSAYRLVDVYGKGNTGLLPEDADVLCDVFEQRRPGGKKTGMPILYYRANRLGTAHRAGDPNNIYDYANNQALVALGVPGEPGKVHPLLDPKRFYLNTQDDRSNLSPGPYQRDSYILIRDGLYGTPDDIPNSHWKSRK